MNKYQSCKIIGRGSSSIVYLVKDHSHQYAVKEFKRRKETIKEYLKRISQEFCIGSCLNHEHIIKTIDLFSVSREEWCLVTEYCSGGDMMKEILTREISLKECNYYFKQLMDGIRFLHSMGVAHRDLKPENLLIQRVGDLKVIKIADFGNAEVFQGPFSHYKHKSRRRGGTEPYMAPEIFKSDDLDAQAIDIWACGIIFITFYYQRWPWEKAIKDDALFSRYLQGKHALIQAIPTYIAECILSMLEINPDKRITLKQIYKNEWFNSLT